MLRVRGFKPPLIFRDTTVVYTYCRRTSIAMQGGLQMKRGRKLTDVFLLHFYTDFTHRVTFSFINTGIKYLSTPVSLFVATDD